MGQYIFFINAIFWPITSNFLFDYLHFPFEDLIFFFFFFFDDYLRRLYIQKVSVPATLTKWLLNFIQFYSSDKIYTDKEDWWIPFFVLWASIFFDQCSFWSITSNFFVWLLAFRGRFLAFFGEWEFQFLGQPMTWIFLLMIIFVACISNKYVCRQ